MAAGLEVRSGMGLVGEVASRWAGRGGTGEDKIAILAKQSSISITCDVPS
jgi:hypothetical protein